LLRFYGGKVEKTDDGVLGLYLLELCKDGSLFDLMAKNQQNKLSEEVIVEILKQVCQGLEAMHRVVPPMSHRDIKIENILILNGTYKLCDFGSATQESFDFK